MPLCKNKDNLLTSIKKVFEYRKTQFPNSFQEFTKGLDIKMLESSWSSIKLSNQKENFKNTWESLLNLLGDLDNRKG